MRLRDEKGQALLLVVVASSLVLAGALGLAIDGAHLFAQRQMAQAAADAAAQAGALSIMGRTNTGTNAFGSGPITCGTTDARTPCNYAIRNGFNTAADTVTVDFPSSVPGVTLSPSYPVAAVHVTVTRAVSATIMRMLGAAATANVSAMATAAIVQVDSPVPILVTHPFNPGSLSLGGNPNIKICGGPQQSIQVNSASGAALYSGQGPAVGTNGTRATIDLSKGGPADTAGNCTTGTGSDMGVFGLPVSSGLPSFLTPTGTTEHYRQPHLPINDPLANVSPPSKPGPPVGNGNLNNGTFGCPAAPPKPCYQYHPGDYPTGINVQNQTAVFWPGVYYIDQGGFSNHANGDMYMCAGCPVSADTGNTGMMVYLANDPSGSNTINVGANSNATLSGSADSSSYLGMLFFVDRNSPAQSHSLGGGGSISLTGTIYATNTTMTATTYQSLTVTGNSGSSTLINGEIIVSELALQGGGVITMQLNPNYMLPLDQVALVK